MKLRYRVSLISLILMTLTVGICSFLTLIQSGKRSLGMIAENAVQAHRSWAYSWSSGVTSHMRGQFSAAAQRSLARYTLEKMDDDTLILMSGEDMIYNRTRIDPSEYLSLSDGRLQYVIHRAGDDSYLITGSRETVGGSSYSFYSVRDVSSVFSDIRDLAFRFSVIHASAVLLCGMILLVLLRFVFKPIEEATESAAKIADGVYDRRITAKGNDEAAALAESFNSMADAIETRIRALREEADRRELLLSALTHELKTPVTGISGNAQMLLTAVMTEEEKEEALIHIDSECRRMENLSQKMMQLILLRQQESLSLIPCDVQTLLDGVHASCAEQLRRKNLTLRIEKEAESLSVEPDLMACLLINLIDNAAKASADGSDIILHATEREISVKDFGCGIPEEEIGRILEPFYRVDKSRSRKAGGIGLGLALVDEIVKLHHAQLEIESVPGQGTTVKVVFQNEA